jgi:DNA-binding transcriptional MerR regulator
MLVLRPKRLEALDVTEASHSSHRVLQAFTTERVARLTGLSRRQLQYWDERGFVSPSVSKRKVGRGNRRLYGFRDLVALRTAALLRGSGISLQHIRKVVAYLRKLDYETPLVDLRFWVWEGKLYFEESGTVREGSWPEQTVAPMTVVPLAAIVDELDQGIERLDAREPGKIERRRGVLGSQPVFAGTRITIASVQRLAKDGADEAEILEHYPDLTPADVAAALSSEEPPRPVSATG